VVKECHTEPVQVMLPRCDMTFLKSQVIVVVYFNENDSNFSITQGGRRIRCRVAGLGQSPELETMTSAPYAVSYLTVW
jgi:hypothetical protein